MEFSVIYWIWNNFIILCYLLLLTVDSFSYFLAFKVGSLLCGCCNIIFKNLLQLYAGIFHLHWCPNEALFGVSSLSFLLVYFNTYNSSFCRYNFWHLALLGGSSISSLTSEFLWTGIISSSCWTFSLLSFLLEL